MWRVTEWTDRIAWNNFLLSQSTQIGIFQQSWEWLTFQDSLGRTTRRIALQEATAPDDSRQLVAVAGLTHLPLAAGKWYWYSPRGPIMREQCNADEFFGLFSEVRNFLRRKVLKSRDVFWRHEPLANTAPLHRGIGGYGATQPLEANALKTRGGQHIIANSLSVDSVQPENTSVIDLNDPDETLFAAMHDKTRYNIRLAIKKGIRVAIEEPAGKPLEAFIAMLEATAARNGFRMHDADYYRAMGKNLSIEKPDRSVMSIRLAMAYNGSTPIAGALVGYFGDTVTYLHGASDHEARALMGPFLLHWEIMRAARTAQYKYYDLWGIDAKKYPGVTNFKIGFGGRAIEYPGTFDLPLSRFWYKLYRAARYLRRM